MYVINFLSLEVNGKIAFDMLYDGVLCYSFKSETNLGQSYMKISVQNAKWIRKCVRQADRSDKKKIC